VTDDLAPMTIRAQIEAVKLDMIDQQRINRNAFPARSFRVIHLPSDIAIAREMPRIAFRRRIWPF